MRGPSSLTLQGVPPVHGLGFGQLRFSPATHPLLPNSYQPRQTVQNSSRPHPDHELMGHLVLLCSCSEPKTDRNGRRLFNRQRKREPYLKYLISSGACMLGRRPSCYTHISHLRDVVVPSSHLINVVKKGPRSSSKNLKGVFSTIMGDLTTI